MSAHVRVDVSPGLRPGSVPPLAPEQQAEDPGARANHGQRRGGPEREHPFEPTLHAGELLHQFDPELRQALLELRVELSPASAPLGVELCEPLLELCVELSPAPAPRGVELCEPLLELRVELSAASAPRGVERCEALIELS